MTTTSNQLYATVLAVNVCMDVACMRVRINGVCVNGKTIPATYPNNTICQITELTVQVQDKDGLRPEDIAHALPGENIIIYTSDDTVQAIKTENKHPELHKILSDLWYSETFKSA